MFDTLPEDHLGRQAKTCRTCGEFKPPQDFPLIRHKRSYAGYQSYTNCNDCERERKERSHLIRSYGITLEEYQSMAKAQDNKCYLCGEPPSDKFGKLVVDHCHKTGEVRKLLCRMCNIHLSKIEACPDYFDRVISYLKPNKNVA